MHFGRTANRAHAPRMAQKRIHKLRNKYYARIYRIISRSPIDARFDFRTSTEAETRAIDLAVSIDNIIDLLFTSTKNVTVSFVFT